MRAFVVGLALLIASPAAADKREPIVVVSTGRLVVLGERGQIRDHLVKASRQLVDAGRKAKNPPLEDKLENARNRLDNAQEFLGFERAEDEPKVFQKEGRDDDERIIEAVTSDRVIVVDLDTLWWELGRADFNLSRASGEVSRPDVLTLIEQARGEISMARGLLAQMVEISPHAVDRSEGPPDSRPPPGYRSPPDSRPPDSRPPNYPPPPVVGPQIVSEQHLAMLLLALERETWTDERLRVLETAARAQWFTVEQVVRVLQRFPFSHQKLRAVALLKDHLADRQNEFQLYAAFVYESDKEALRNVLAGVELEAPKPIDDASLGQLVAQLKHSWASQVGFQRLRDEAPRRWFLVDQVSMILSVFPTFDSRFRALEIVRPRILDPESWARLEPLFATMQDRARLRSLFAPGH